MPTLPRRVQAVALGVLPVLEAPHVLGVLVRADVEVVQRDEKARRDEKLGRLVRVFNCRLELRRGVRPRLGALDEAGQVDPFESKL